jgi:hypothetical protein
MSNVSVALVLHGKIGVWTLRSSDVPAGNLRSAPHNKLHANAMAAPPKTPVQASNVSLWDLERWPHSLRTGFARFASHSILRNIVEPNRRAGTRVDIFLHSWHPDLGAELDAMYAPAASRHDPVQNIHRVASQHLSMKRGLALAAAHDQPHDLVMVARYDLLFFSVLRFAELPPPAEVQLWLPTWCMRYEFPSGRQRGALSRACGGGQPAYVMTPPLVSAMHPRMARAPRAMNADFAVLDWWFVAPPHVAATFGQV